MSNLQDIVIVGSGGLGREVLWMLRREGSVLRDVNGVDARPYVLGFLDEDPTKHGTSINGAAVLGGLDWLEEHPGCAIALAIGHPGTRERIANRLASHDLNFPACLPSETIVGDEVRVGEGTIVLPGAIFTCNTRIGRFVLINPHVSISHDGVIGDFTSIGPGVSLPGNVQIGRGCDIGTQASAIPGATVGAHAVIGAGACVVQPIPANSTAVGVPARVISMRDPDNAIFV